MTDVLTIESAKAYAARIFPQCAFGNATMGEENGIPVINVELTWECGAPGTMTVWVENGRLYGEA